MRQRQASAMKVTRITLNGDDDEVMFVVLFHRTEGAYFSLHQMSSPEYQQVGGPIMRVDDRKELHSELLNETQVWPGAQLAYVVHEFGGVDHEPGGSVVINVLGHQGSLPNGRITIDIPRRQVAAGYIQFVAKDAPEPESARPSGNEDDNVDEED